MHCRAYHFAAFCYIMNGQITETGETKCHTITNIHTNIHTSIHMTTSMNTHMLMSTGTNIHTATSITTESMCMTTATSIRRSTPKPF